MAKTWKDIAALASQLAQDRGEWAGAPVPVEGMALSIAPRYGLESDLRGLDGAKFGPDDEDEPDLPNVTQINTWYSWRNKGVVFIFDENGKRQAILDRSMQDTYFDRYDRLLSAIEITTVQDPAAEITAQEKLHSMIKPHLWALYTLQGLFLETSAKSGITYVFRKSRPTLALTPRPWGQMRILCALCLHPLAYYEDSFYGAMVPTDEVISHLLLMRADEHRYWRMANQHPPHDWRAGL